MKYFRFISFIHSFSLSFFVINSYIKYNHTMCSLLLFFVYC